MRSTWLFFLLTMALFGLLLLSLSIGSVWIPAQELLQRALGQPFTRESHELIFFAYRLPKALTAILAGIALSLSGLQMQTYFKNPLAGPYVLGISSGAGLGVAVLLLSGSALQLPITAAAWGSYGITLAASLGAALVLLAISFTAWRVRDSMTLLIVGLMVGSLTGSIVSLLAYFSDAEQLKRYTVWSMGSLGSLPMADVLLFALVCVLGILPLVFQFKAFDAMLLGEAYAKSMGISTRRLRRSMLLSTGLLAGAATAFCGPIAFIGIAVPHIARLLFQTAQHRILFPGTALVGACLLLLCDSISQVPGSATTLPLNAITSLFGAPIVIALILKRNFSKSL
ncbi:ABC transporter permease [Nitritalea halalkaliphila LW7]|uniref:ABC transporter permease n=1 Tax=Nitritalea halalkaliphila LW7 TaxID=1189621 RepID=I5CA51_9BACT|nr:iron ABC transporter permease [Nitritalea halalkaliphila]EIM78703.1 ABC transporter permease [Nitritalea halalkaliphila LW7]